VTLAGHDVYLGRFGSPESEERYQRAIAEWLANGRMAPTIASGPTVAEVLVPYVEYCDRYYCRPDGTPTGEADNIRLAIRPLRELYAHLPASDFGPSQLRAVRQRLIATVYRGKSLSRGEVNRRTRIVVRAFKWAACEGLVLPSVWHGLKCVEGLKRGRSEARETTPVHPVSIAHVDATLPFLSRPVAAMVRLQLLCGVTR
jgi:hypothetical protein